MPHRRSFGEVMKFPSIHEASTSSNMAYGCRDFLVLERHNHEDQYSK